MLNLVVLAPCRCDSCTYGRLHQARLWRRTHHRPRTPVSTAREGRALTPSLWRGGSMIADLMCCPGSNRLGCLRVKLTTGVAASGRSYFFSAVRACFFVHILKVSRSTRRRRPHSSADQDSVVGWAEANKKQCVNRSPDRGTRERESTAQQGKRIEPPDSRQKQELRPATAVHTHICTRVVLAER